MCRNRHFEDRQRWQFRHIRVCFWLWIVLLEQPNDLKLGEWDMCALNWGNLYPVSRGWYTFDTPYPMPESAQVLNVRFVRFSGQS